MKPRTMDMNMSDLRDQQMDDDYLSEIYGLYPAESNVWYEQVVRMSSTCCDCHNGVASACLIFFFKSSPLIWELKSMWILVSRQWAKSGELRSRWIKHEIGGRGDD